MTNSQRREKTPPRLAEQLLERHLPVGIAERSIRGDLREEYDFIRTERSRVYAYVWYWLHTLRLCLRFAFPGFNGQRRTKRRRHLADSAIRDVRYASRCLAKNPGFTIIAVTTLALGIGASTVAYTLVNGVLIRPLPIPEADRLLLLEEQRENGRVLKLSFPNFEDWRNESRTLEGILGVLFPIPATIHGPDEPVRGTVLRVSREFFDIARVQPWLGRAISYDENSEGGESVAVLGYEFWQRHFGSNPSLEELSVTISGVPATVIGVMPRGFRLLEEGDVYVPMEQQPFRVRDSHNYRAVGRLAPGISIATAQEELNSIAARIREAYPNETQTVAVRITPFRDVVLGDVDRPLLLLLGAAGMLLLIACSNVASTLLARGTMRGRELAIRTAVGASRGRLISLLLVESLLLATVAGLVGLGSSYLTLGLIRSIGVDLVPRLQTVSIDSRVFLFAILATFGTAVAFGLTPALRVSSVRNSKLNNGQRGDTMRRRGAGGNALVAAEAALAVVLVVACGLLLRSLQQVLSEQTNIRADGVLTVDMDLRGAGQSTNESRANLLEEIKREFRSLPGVDHVGYVSYLPTIPNMMTGRVFKSPAPVERDPNRPGYPSAWRVVDEDYFATMGVPLLSGRVFSSEDRSDAPPVIVINESLANSIFPGGDAIGQLINFLPFWMEPDLTVIGVVAESRDWNRAAGSQPEAYVHWPQRMGYTRDMTAVLHTSGSPMALIGPARERLRAVATDVPGTFRTMHALMNESLRERTFTLAVLSSFAIVSLILAAVGIYGVVSYAVSSQAREIGIRLALGAEPGAVRRRIFSSTIAIVAIGAAVGIGCALLSGKVIESMLYEVSSRDFTTLAVAPGVLLAAAIVAIAFPVIRCTRVDPVEVLRTE